LLPEQVEVDQIPASFKPLAMLRVWGRRNSQNVQKVLWFVGELGLPYELVPAGGTFGRLSDTEFRELNPNGLIPVIQDGDTTIWESHSILRYLAAEYGGERYWPKSAADRSHQDRWMDWCQTLWDPAFVSGVFWGFYRTPEKDRDWASIKKSLERCRELSAIVEHQLADNMFLAGERLSLGDIPLGASLYRYFSLDIERPALPSIEGWYERLASRPAYQEHVMVPFGDLKGRLAF
jgi:glutathione S-transferase